ncbi:MAG TPA: hypothetical protein VHR88_04675 [Solirubrobacteraceae bacterium]|jgi:hypothetical protein|nr:hypothetical protein [Solirubrobacteraceae bacterium]
MRASHARRGPLAFAVPLVLLAGLALAAPLASAAARRSAGELFGKRYCEVLELRGTPPGALVTVWNTIGFSFCPPARWNALDPAAIASARGDTAIVLNGPRHWLMDAATGRTGPSQVFGGLRFRQVATIPIKSPDELAQTPYTERTIVRRNTWLWSKGRQVYELHAPSGATYVMQSWSQIKDPSERLADLPTLGSRLMLPAGWRYTVRRLRRDLVLIARGSATVVQDELLDTYQREP